MGSIVSLMGSNYWSGWQWTKEFFLNFAEECVKIVTIYLDWSQYFVFKGNMTDMGNKNGFSQKVSAVIHQRRWRGFRAEPFPSRWSKPCHFLFLLDFFSILYHKLFQKTSYNPSLSQDLLKLWAHNDLMWLRALFQNSPILIVKFDFWENKLVHFRQY